MRADQMQLRVTQGKRRDRPGGRRALSRVVVSDRFAAVQHERDPEVGARRGHLVERRRGQLETLRIRVELAGSAQAHVGASAQLGDRARLARG